MSTASSVKLINLLSDRYKFDADDAIEYVKTASKKGRPKKQIEVEQAKDLFDKILEDAGEPPLEKDPALYKKFEKAPEKVNKTAEKEAKKLEKEKKAAEKAAEKEKKAAEKEAKKLEKEKKASEKESKKQEKEKKAAGKETKKEVKPVVSSTIVVAPKPPVKTVTQVDSSDDDSSDDEEEEEADEQLQLKPEEKELVVIKHTPIEELVIDESSEDEVDEDVNKIVQSLMKAKMAKCEAKKESDDESEEEDDSDDEEEEDEEEVVKVKRVKINNKDYLKSSNNVLYDVDTNDAIGVWDENKQEIILNELDEDSYVEEDNNEESEDSDDDE